MSNRNKLMVLIAELAAEEKANMETSRRLISMLEKMAMKITTAVMARETALQALEGLYRSIDASPDYEPNPAMITSTEYAIQTSKESKRMQEEMLLLNPFGMFGGDDE